MTATKVQLTGGGFQDAEGNLLANGYLEFVLSQDSSVTGVGNIAAGVTIRIQLDSVGNAASSASSPAAADQYIWGNDVLNTPNTFYKVTGFTTEGQPAWGPNNQQVYGSSPFDLGTWVPNTVYQWTPPVQQVSLNVNGVAASSQIRQNLESTDDSVTITDEGNGNINLQAASGFAAGSNVVSISPFSAGGGNLSSHSLVLCIPAGLIQATGTSLKVGLSFYGITSVVIDSAVIGATAPNPIASVGSFSYDYSWTTAPVAMTWPAGSFLNDNQVYFSNPVDITVDTNHDYYIIVYLDSTNDADCPYLSPGDASQVVFTDLAGWVTGDHTADSDASEVAGQDRGVFSIQQVVIG